MLLTNSKKIIAYRMCRIDDIQDSLRLRRGLPVAHSIFGHAHTINSANYDYFVAFREVEKLESAAAINIFIEGLINLYCGQGLDLFWRDSKICLVRKSIWRW